MFGSSKISANNSKPTLDHRPVESGPGDAIGNLIHTSESSGSAPKKLTVTFGVHKRDLDAYDGKKLSDYSDFNKGVYQAVKELFKKHSPDAGMYSLAKSYMDPRVLKRAIGQDDLNRVMQLAEEVRVGEQTLHPIEGEVDERKHVKEENIDYSKKKMFRSGGFNTISEHTIITDRKYTTVLGQTMRVQTTGETYLVKKSSDQYVRSTDQSGGLKPSPTTQMTLTGVNPGNARIGDRGKVADLLSQDLGINCAPKVALAQVKGKVWMFMNKAEGTTLRQYYHDNKGALNDPRFQESLDEIQAFAFIMGHPDSHWENIMAHRSDDKSVKMTLIDFDVACGHLVDGEISYLKPTERNKEIFEDQAQHKNCGMPANLTERMSEAIRSLDESAIDGRFGRHLNAGELRAMKNRVASAKEQIAIMEREGHVKSDYSGMKGGEWFENAMRKPGIAVGFDSDGNALRRPNNIALRDIIEQDDNIAISNGELEKEIDNDPKRSNDRDKEFALRQSDPVKAFKYKKLNAGDFGLDESQGERVLKFGKSPPVPGRNTSQVTRSLGYPS